MRRSTALHGLAFAAGATLGLASAPSATEAQTPGREPAVVEIPASTRALSLGHAYQLGAPDADVVFYNPALLGEADGSIVGGAHLLGDEALGFTVSGARSWFGGAVGLGLQVLEHASPGPGARPGGLDPLLRGEGEGVAEMAASLGVSRRVLGVRVGVTGKVVAQRYPDFRQASAALDVGVAHRLGPLTLGLAVQNLGPDRAITPDGEVPQPLRVTLGAGGYGRRVGPLDMGVAAALSVRDDGDVLGGGGVELAYWPVVGRTFIARVGARTVPEGEASPLTLGASYRGDELVLEWGWERVDDLGDVHRFSIGWR